jgi:DNA-directed RNA polymerase subunit RPC12/RpoP
MMKGKGYVCAMCGGRFETTWSDEEALAEMRENFSDIPVSETEIVCDDCYLKVMSKRRKRRAQP